MPGTYLSPATIARIGNLQVVARMVVEGALSGQHKSPSHGFNVEFAQHRPYQPGDELRHVDWKYFAKTDEYFVKQFEESTSLRAWVLLDTSKSMAFGEGPLTKLEYARYLAAALGYVMIHQHDHVGLATFADQLQAVIPPRAHPSQLHRLLEAIGAPPGREKTDMFSVFRALAGHLKRRHLVAVVSDLLDDPENLLRGIRYLKGLGHEVMLLHVLAPEELEFGYEGMVEFEDLENPGSRLTVDTSSLASRYREEVALYLKTLHEGARAMRVDVELFRIDQPMEEGLGRFLARRSREGN